MKVILPFGDAFIKQNPKETLMFSILSANNDYEDLLESFWDFIGYSFEDNNLQYYDAHILGEFRSLNHITKKVDDIHSSKFIQFVEESLRQKYYILSILDWNEMECFKLQGAKYFPHEVAIFGFDNKEEIIYVSDFLHGRKYVQGKASYYEIENAYENVCLNLQNIPYYAKKDIPNIYLYQYANNSQPNIFRVRNMYNQINNFLKNSVSENSYMEKESILRVTQEGIYHIVPIKKISYGKDVLLDIQKHAKMVLFDKKYIYERKNINLLAIMIKLFYLRLKLIKNIYGEIFLPETKRLEKQVSDMCIQGDILLVMSLKYEMKGENDILKRIIIKTVDLINKYIDLLEECVGVLESII